MDISSLLVLGVHVVDQVNDPVGVAVLVIVPRKKEKLKLILRF